MRGKWTPMVKPGDKITLNQEQYLGLVEVFDHQFKSLEQLHEDALSLHLQIHDMGLVETG